MIYTVQEARELIAAGWKLVEGQGGHFTLIRGRQVRRVYRNVALSIRGS